MEIKLENIPFFTGLTDKETHFILPYVAEKKFAKGEVIIAQGSRGGDLYLLISGLVSVDIVLPGDYQKCLATLGPNDLFGEVTFLTEALVTASVVALEPCTCVIFYHDLLEILRTSNPEISFKIEREITHQIANKITSNINNILKILNAIPKELQEPSELAIYLDNPAAYCKELAIRELDFNRIEKLNFLSQMSKKQIFELMPLLKVKSYGRGYRFLVNDKNINKLGLVYSGAVMLFIKENEQLIKPIAISGAGEMFLQNFIFPDFCQIADYVTCEKSIILELDMDVYQQLHHSNPALFYIISEAINRTIAGSVYIVDRQFLRINSEYNNIII